MGQVEGHQVLLGHARFCSFTCASGLFHRLKRRSKTRGFSSARCVRGQLLKLTIYMDWKQNMANSCHHTRCHHTLHQKLLTRQAQTHFLIFPLNVASKEQTTKQIFFPPVILCAFTFCNALKATEVAFSQVFPAIGETQSMLETRTCS